MRQNISSTVTANLSKMSQGTNSSLNDTIPLDKKTCGQELSDLDKTYYGSELSMSAGGSSKESSVKILYEVINLTESKSKERDNQEVTLKFQK